MGAIPGFFKAYFNVNEILSTIMLNLVAVQLMNYLLAGPLVDRLAGSRSAASSRRPGSSRSIPGFRSSSPAPSCTSVS